MASNTFTKIATVTVGSGGASSIDFSSIPSTYTDLCLKLSARDNRAFEVDGITIRFNGDTTSGNYSGKRIYGSGSSASSDSTNNGLPFFDGNNSTASVFCNTEIYIPNYTSSNYKSLSIDGVAENNATTVYMGFGALLWTSTSAINRVTITPEVGTSINQYSTATLYGIKNS